MKLNRYCAIYQTKEQQVCGQNFVWPTVDTHLPVESCINESHDSFIYWIRSVWSPIELEALKSDQTFNRTSSACTPCIHYMYWPKVFASLNNLLSAYLSTAYQHPTFQEPSEPLVPRSQKACLELAATNPFPCVRIERIASHLPYAMKCDAWIVIHVDYDQLIYVTFCKTDLQSAPICIWESWSHDYMHRAYFYQRIHKLTNSLPWPQTWNSMQLFFRPSDKNMLPHSRWLDTVTRSLCM